MIEFSSPPIALNLSGYMELAEKWEACSPCAGFCVAAGEKFFSSGYREVDTKVLPALEAKASSGVIPRVLPSYSILYWFSLQVCYTLLHVCVTIPSSGGRDVNIKVDQVL